MTLPLITTSLMNWFFLGMVLLISTAKAHANADWIEAFDVIWEMQWHQSGNLTNVGKWKLADDNVIRYRFNSGISNERNIGYTEEALKLISAETGINFQRVDGSDGNAELRFNIVRFADSVYETACGNTGLTHKNYAISAVTVNMDERCVYRVVLHELMHAMGIFGHPQTGSVLSYFEAKRRSLSNIDKVVLRNWYSSAISPGMNAFIVTKVLSQKWIEATIPIEQQADAFSVERKWFASITSEMDRFASGQGEPPRILYRTGRMNPESLNGFRRRVQVILGAFFLEGVGSERRVTRARDLLLDSAISGDYEAAIVLGRGQLLDQFADADMKSACDWWSKALRSGAKRTKAELDGINRVLNSKSCRAN